VTAILFVASRIRQFLYFAMWLLPRLGQATPGGEAFYVKMVILIG